MPHAPSGRRAMVGPGHINPRTVFDAQPLYYPTAITGAVFTETVGITDSLGVVSTYVPFDSWRPVPKPDGNELMLVCRTPEGTHDSEEGLEELSFWTIRPDGTGEHQVLTDPTVNGYGWTKQWHPEWSPDGNQIVFVVDDGTETKLILLNSSSFGVTYD